MLRQKLITPPWQRLADFFCESNPQDIQVFAANAPQYGNSFWTINQHHFNCLNYAFEYTDIQKAEIGELSLLELDQIIHSESDIAKNTKRYCHFFNACAQNLTKERIRYPEIEINKISKELTALLKAGLKIVETPEDLPENHYLTAFTRSRYGNWNFIRQDQDGDFSEKPGCRYPPRKVEQSPFHIHADSIPVCFLAAPA